MEFVSYENKAGIAWVTIDRQSKLNALNPKVLDELELTFKNLQDDSQVFVIVLTGAGDRAFVAGADISQFPLLTSDEAYAFARRGQDVYSLIESSRKPVIAAVNGFALGGGCELALACHIRIASETAVFGQPEVKLGVIAGYGGTQRLPRLIGPGRALDMLLTGRMVNADEALSMGLANEVVAPADLNARVEAYSKLLMEQGSLAQAFTLEAVFGGMGKPMEERLLGEADAFRSAFQTEDRIEGATAFLERRSPQFKNR